MRLLLVLEASAVFYCGLPGIAKRSELSKPTIYLLGLPIALRRSPDEQYRSLVFVVKAYGTIGPQRTVGSILAPRCIVQ